jgi:hypothetical protein
MGLRAPIHSVVCQSKVLDDFGEQECVTRIHALAKDIHDESYEVDQIVILGSNEDVGLNTDAPLEQILSKQPKEILSYFETKGTKGYKHQLNHEDWKTRKALSVSKLI